MRLNQRFCVTKPAGGLPIRPPIRTLPLTIRARSGNLLVEYENLILMTERSRGVRLSPLPADQWDEGVEKALSGLFPADRLNPEAAGNFVATLVRHPKLARNYLRFSFYLLYGSTLPERVRELAVLRVAHLSNCTYEWEHHTRMGREAGLTDEVIDGVARGEAFDEFDRAVLAAVDQLHDKSVVSDPTWAALSEHLDEQQLMDLVFTVGSYGALAMAINTFGVEPDKEH
jgi:4-carboxymuconolactone decarboxylase